MQFGLGRQKDKLVEKLAEIASHADDLMEDLITWLRYTYWTASGPTL